MKTLLLTTFTLAAILATAPAQSPTATPAPQYEAPPVLKASQIWEGNLLSGPNHKVREEVTTSGFTNTYAIDSDFGTFYAHGDHMLLERVREVYAIAAIRKTKETDAYAQAIGSGAMDSVNGAKDLIKDPVGSIKGLGKGASRFLRSAGERAKNVGTGNDAAKSLKQYTSAKREIAGQYQVDPYTSNAVYQAEVDSVAKAASVGGLTFKLAAMAIPGGAGIAFRGLGTSEKFNQILVESGPYDLRVQNRGRLKAMAVSESLIEPFLDHPHFTPRHRTAITLALQQLAGTGGRGDYIRLALAARSEEDAFFFSKNAGLLALYNAKRAKLDTIIDCNGIPAAYTDKKRLVLPILLDYGSWTEVGAQFVESIAAFNRADLPIDSRELVVTGVLSPRAKQETEARGVAVTDKAFETLAK